MPYGGQNDLREVKGVKGWGLLCPSEEEGNENRFKYTHIDTERYLYPDVLGHSIHQRSKDPEENHVECYMH